MYRISKWLSFFVLAGALLGCSSLNKLLHKSGTEFTVKISTDVADKDPIIEKAVRSLEKKISSIGLDGEVATIDGSPDVVKVKIYGDQPLDPVRKTLFTTYQLELRQVAIGQNSYETEAEARVKASGGQEVLQGKGIGEGDRPVFYIIEKESVINGDDIRNAKASASPDATSNYEILFSLKPESAEKFGVWTGTHIGNYLAIVLNKEVLSAPVIKGRIADQGTIEGRFTKEEAEDIALNLSSGYLPATMTVVDEAHFGN